MTICHSCNGQVQPQARFCDQCGATLKGPGETVFETGQQNHGKFQRWVIGGSAECDLVVNDQKVSGKHCLLIETPDGFLLQDLDSTNGTYVNGRKITSQVKISRSDNITLGHSAPMPWPLREVPREVTPNVMTDPKAKVIRIGGEPDNDVVLDYPMVSGHHARITIVNGAAVIEDLNSTNGTAIGNPKNKIKRSPLTLKDVVYFGSLRQPASRLIGGKLTLGAKAQAELAFTGQTMTIGRDPKCDLALDYPMVSWQHARLTRAGNQITVEDLGSTNGTFVNGQRISGAVRVKPGDVIGLGSYTFHLTQAGRLEKRDYRGNLTIEGAGLTVEVPGKRLIEDISLTIYPSELVGLMGPSGAGKTTLMNVLNGYSKPTGGAVFCNGTDLYANYVQFAGHIGYVPQDDIMHRDLTVGQALYYTARLRLPGDFSDDEIRQRIAKVLGQLGLQGTEDVLIGSPERKGISGGQRKRVNLAMELLTDPSVLILDEPTSGLSSVDALMVMKMLRQLADDGKTIIIAIHQPSRDVFSLLDNLVVISRDESTKKIGRLAYYGPAYPDSIYFFNPNHPGRMAQEDQTADRRPSPDELLDGLERTKTAEWVRRYEASDYKRQYVTERTGKRPSNVELAPSGVSRRPGMMQWWTLTKRCFEIKLKDSWGTGILLAQAPIIALLIVLVFGKQVGMDPRPVSLDQPDVIRQFYDTAVAMRVTMFLMVVAALWFGCSNAAQEIVGELAVYRRERKVNLKIPSYIGSKFSVLGLMCVIQCLLLAGIVYLGCGLRGALPPIYGTLTLTALVGVALGLAASAWADTMDRASRLVPIILLPMIIMGGALLPVDKMTLPWTTHIIPSRWSYEALLLTETDSRGRIPIVPGWNNEEKDMAYEHFPPTKRSGAKTSIAVLGGTLAVLVFLILALLKWRDKRP
ncbi:MAG: FHA domain-containing protein [Acidobacteria bacterium]|nr:FHA domain-containing protein [Acidobacteriota bacterium]